VAPPPDRALERKVLFFEKKNQKTFAMAAGMRVSTSSEMPDEICKSFLLLVFKKEESFLFPFNFSRARLRKAARVAKVK
jgi:hypothetical protein